MSKTSRGESGENQVIEVLNRIKEPHYLLNNLTFLNKKSDMSHQIDHILIHPHGVFVIETKNYYGEIVYYPSTKEWYKVIRGKKQRIISPLSQNKSHEITLYRLLKGQYKIIPVVVYVRNNAPYMPDDNVINLEDLLLFIDSYPNKKLYSQKEMDNIKVLIERESAHLTTEEHVDNIKILKELRKQK